MHKTGVIQGEINAREWKHADHEKERRVEKEENLPLRNDRYCRESKRLLWLALDDAAAAASSSCAILVSLSSCITQYGAGIPQGRRLEEQRG